MPTQPLVMSGFFEEVKRRKVYQVAVGYVIAAGGVGVGGFGQVEGFFQVDAGLGEGAGVEGEPRVQKLGNDRVRVETGELTA